jgi:P-type Cu+ transporter
MPVKSTVSKTTCYHCGEDCDDDIILGNKPFCCEGCKMVYEIINHNGLCNYYNIENNPGITQKIKVREGKFAFLDNAEIELKLLQFSQDDQKHITFYLPQMHCSSCIWLLENLGKINRGIVRSEVNFTRKEASVIYNSSEISLRQVAELLTSIGYEPHISLNDISGKKIKKFDRSKIYKIGIAGFCFGNIMLLSFPEYFGILESENLLLSKWFGYLNVILALPVFFYCSAEFFVSAWKSLRQRFLNIDAPIALAVLITFVRSIYEILSETGAGYLDSMSGIVFFMLVGRFLQDRTFQSLSFDRDYTSYFPVGVSVINEDGTEKQIAVSDIRKGHRIKIHSDEIVPADGILFSGKASIDYSFVTGESLPVEKTIGEIVYAGGKQSGAAIELEVVKEVSQSYLTQLWNNDTFNKKGQDKKVSFIHRISRHFTIVLFSIAIATAMYWVINEPSRTWNAVTAVLIVACPCALLLSATFTNGNMLSILHKNNFFVKNANVLEGIADTDTIVFDKTGTISMQHTAAIEFHGSMSPYEENLARSLASQSNHPLSRAITSFLPFNKRLPVKEYHEQKGKGSSGTIHGEYVKMGSFDFVSGKQANDAEGSKVYVSVNDKVKGCFVIRGKYRKGLDDLIKDLHKKYMLAVISGDNDSEAAKLSKLFGEDSTILFDQKPQDKLNFIRSLQENGHRVIMIGDGLNDAGALQQSNVGIAVTDDVNNFTPGCDVIFDGRSFSKLQYLLDFCTKEKRIIYGSFVLSILYNIIGLFFAVQGTLSPVIAAILMPVSSVSIMLYTTLMSNLYAKKIPK